MIRLTFALMLFLGCNVPASAEAIHDAARRGDLEQVRSLIEAGAKIDAIGKSGDTPIILAILNGHASIVRALLENGVGAMSRNERGFTALHAAAFVGDVDIVQLLVDRGADIHDAQNKAGVTPLFPAIEENHRAAAELLIAAGADLSAKERHGYSLLVRAVFKDHDDMARLLKKHGASCPPEVLGDYFYPRCLEMGN